MIDAPFSLEEVADRLAIEHVVNRYVHALDTRAYDALDDVFLPGCTFDIGGAGSQAALWPDVKAFYEASLLDTFPHYLHTLNNVLITFDADRSTAHTVSKVINPAGQMGQDGRMHHFDFYGHWHDDWKRVPDGWRIANRRWENLWIAGDYPFVSLPADAANADILLYFLEPSLMCFG